MLIPIAWDLQPPASKELLLWMFEGRTRVLLWAEVSPAASEVMGGGGSYGALVGYKAAGGGVRELLGRL